MKKRGACAFCGDSGLLDRSAEDRPVELAMLAEEMRENTGVLALLKS